MAAIKVTKEAGKTAICRKQNGTTWMLCIPYLMLFCFEVAIPIAAVYRLVDDLATRQPIHEWVAPVGLLFAAKVVWFGSYLYKTLAARSVLVIQGDTIQISTGQFGHMEDVGTYSVSVLGDLGLQSGNNRILPTGKVSAQIGDERITLADRVSDADGTNLIDEMCAVFPFSTPEASVSPAVVRWDWCNLAWITFADHPVSIPVTIAM